MNGRPFKHNPPADLAEYMGYWDSEKEGWYFKYYEKTDLDHYTHKGKYTFHERIRNEDRS